MAYNSPWNLPENAEGEYRFTNRYDAVVVGLALAITAPTDEWADDIAAMVNILSADLTEGDCQRAKIDAQAKVREWGFDLEVRENKVREWGFDLEEER